MTLTFDLLTVVLNQNQRLVDSEYNVVTSYISNDNVVLVPFTTLKNLSMSSDLF